MDIEIVSAVICFVLGVVQNIVPRGHFFLQINGQIVAWGGVIVIGYLVIGCLVVSSKIDCAEIKGQECHEGIVT